MMFDKRQLKTAMRISHKERLRHDDYLEYSRFISGVMIGAGYEAKCYVRDYLPFFNKYKPNWMELYNYYIEVNKDWDKFLDKYSQYEDQNYKNEKILQEVLKLSLVEK